MTIELSMLFWAVVLTFGQMLVAVLLAMLQVGLPALVGNREDVVETAVAGRAKRAHRNMLENLVLFAALVLVVQVAGLNDTNTALGAQIFVYARLAHAVIYLIGIPWLRTAAWGISAVGLVMVALPIFAA
jgi:uncharacterized MAPEG superfamily protein|tara:strand:- start:165 stop:554 length:390 start_codon:yes stop_codon:yes gene_type:complete